MQYHTGRHLKITRHRAVEVIGKTSCVLAQEWAGWASGVY